MLDRPLWVLGAANSTLGNTSRIHLLDDNEVCLLGEVEVEWDGQSSKRLCSRTRLL